MAEKINGIFYEVKALNVGAMGTQKVTQGSHDLHYWVKEHEDGKMGIYYLKPDGSPTAIEMEAVRLEVFKTRFKDCSTHECNFKTKTEEEKQQEKVDATVRQGEKHLENNEYNAATYEFGNALKKDQKNLRAHFGKGKAHIALGEVDKAKEHFDQMSENEDLYDEKHKHLFNELGIELRKNDMFSEAIGNYNKALEIDASDPILYYNIARAYKDQGKKDDAVGSIKKALELKPDFKEAALFLKSLEAGATPPA